MNRTTGPAKNNCQQSAIGKLSAVVSSHTEIISTPAFLKIRVAARLIRGHIKITEIAEIASTRKKGLSFAGFTILKASFLAM